MKFFRYGQTEIEYLKKKDKKLAEAIDRIGIIERSVIPDLFTAVISSIVGQQISNKAAVTVWNRLLERLGQITPQKIVDASAAEIQQCGITMKKTGYIKGIAEDVLQGKININELAELPDDEVVKRLSVLNGIGVWTVEMLMIFSLERTNIVSWGDLAIRRGMMLLYHHRTLDKVKFEKYKKRYSPYGTVASLYLWEIAAGR
ncbi:MAG: HhH-GPD family protein [Firmicutes bacterium]|nr:HhH-GPD family protein [Bacillota bacterium]